MEKGNERIAELVIQLKGGSNSAFNELYKLTSGRAYFVALEITKNEQDAEDVLQESYVKMLEKIGTLDKPESFVSWFHHIVANKSKDSLKKKKPGLFEGGEDEAFEVIPDEDTSFSPEENLNQDELHNAVIEVIGELSEEKRACVMMMYFEEMSVNEISETLEIPVSTVKNRLFTARKDLKAKFEKRGITSLYSAAPIGVVVWALTRAADRVSTNFVESGSSARILSGITISGTAAATAAATATTAATVSTAGAASTAATGAAVAAKAVVLTAAQKIMIGLAAVGVIGGTATGAVFTVKEIREYNANKNTETLTIVQEEVTTAPETESETVLPAVVTVTDTTTSVKSTTAATTKPTTTQGATTTQRPATATTTRATTTRATTTRPTTTRATTTRATTTRPTTTRRQTTTTEPETEAPTTTTTTAPTTTTEAPDAILNIKVLDFNNNVVDEFSVSIEPGTAVSHSNVLPYITGAGYTPTSGIGGVSNTLIAQSGETYNIQAYL